MPDVARVGAQFTQRPGYELCFTRSARRFSNGPANLPSPDFPPSKRVQELDNGLLIAARAFFKTMSDLGSLALVPEDCIQHSG